MHSDLCNDGVFLRLIHRTSTSWVSGEEQKWWLGAGSTQSVGRLLLPLPSEKWYWFGPHLFASQPRLHFQWAAFKWLSLQWELCFFCSRNCYAQCLMTVAVKLKLKWWIRITWSSWRTAPGSELLRLRRLLGDRSRTCCVLGTRAGGL